MEITFAIMNRILSPLQVQYAYWSLQSVLLAVGCYSMYYMLLANGSYNTSSCVLQLGQWPSACPTPCYVLFTSKGQCAVFITHYEACGVTTRSAISCRRLWSLVAHTCKGTAHRCVVAWQSGCIF